MEIYISKLKKKKKIVKIGTLGSLIIIKPNIHLLAGIFEFQSTAKSFLATLTVGFAILKMNRQSMVYTNIRESDRGNFFQFYTSLAPF